MFDVRSNPSLLKQVLANYVPEKDRPFSDSSRIATAVESIKSHGLLSESLDEATDQKLADRWRKAVDDWFERLLHLVSSNATDKCLAGIWLIGITCEECSMERFLSSYPTWLKELSAKLELPSDSQFVKVASCASLSDLVLRSGGSTSGSESLGLNLFPSWSVPFDLRRGRLSGSPNLKKEGTSHSGKLVQLVLKLLTEDGSEAVWGGSLDLLCTLINCFPSSAHKHYDRVEALIVSKLISGNCNSDISKKLAHCLALLPRAGGDEKSWDLMMQKILKSINDYLTDALQDPEDERKSVEIMRLLVPPGKATPSPLGGIEFSKKMQDQAALRSEEWLFSRVSMLMLCCCKILTNPFPVQVNVPIHVLIALVRRVLSIDGSWSQPSRLPQGFVCSELPMLHLQCLDMLTAMIKAIRSQLLPHAGVVVKLLKEYFGRCTLPALRIKVYSIIQILLISMGVGMSPLQEISGSARCLAEEVIRNAFSDLDAVGKGICESSPLVFSKQEVYGRKRKHVSIAVPSVENRNDGSAAGELPRTKLAAPRSVQIAALRALETLLTIGGGLIPDSQRSNVDRLLITVATNASLQALLACLLSSIRVYPRYLSEACEIFRRGKREIGTKVSLFCAHALLALELLVHPRALPLYDFPSSSHGTIGEGLSHQFPDNIFSLAKTHRASFGPDPGDVLFNSWLGNGEDVEAAADDADNKTENAVENSENHAQQSIHGHPEENPTVNGKFDLESLEEANGAHIDAVSTGQERTGDNLMIDAQGPAVFNDGGDVRMADESNATHSNPMQEEEMETTKAVDDAAAPDAGILIPCSNDNSMADEQTLPPSLSTNATLASETDTVTAGNAPNQSLNVATEDSDLDSIPDIIVGDPDSDPDSD
ncbi:hypothetical protein Syun_029109 [Stephania yunnanensis]|uniref:Pre-rRNA-processing protein RIX1 N-terminal domain-containing protein n=1 Tax=Stephania yunnanensis TaxID=152371 RepID=A0AAP0HL29_9MAGN